MKKFVVAYISFFDNNLKQQIVTGTDELSVMQYVMMQNGVDLTDTPKEIEALKQFAFDCDSMISAIEV